MNITKLFCYIPQAIDWQIIFDDFNPRKGVTVPKLNYFLGHILSGVVFHDIEIHDLVPIHSATMGKIITNYSIIKDYLIEAHILETDNQYVVGMKSKSYCLTQQYRGPVRKVEIKCQSIIDRLNKMRNKTKDDPIDANEFLRQFFCEKLTIDVGKVQDECCIIMEEIPRWLDTINLTPYYSILQSATMIDSCNFHFCTDPTSGRVHHNLTNLKTEARGLLKYNGERLGGVDVSNSQPYLFGGFLKMKMYLYENPFLEKCLESCSPQVYNSILKSLNLLRKEITIGDDLSEYIKHVESGTFYDLFMTELNIILTEGNVPIVTSKKIIKKEIITIFYCENHSNGFSPYRKWLKQIFKKYFPTVYEAIFILKSVAYNSFAIMLQCIEKELIIKQVAKECVELGMVPVFTIHDSIASNVNNLERIETIMQRTLTETMGITPNLKVEVWESKPLITKISK